MTVIPNMGHVSDSSLPPSMLAVLPADPYDQLDIARKITSMAVSSRVGQLEAEAGKLRLKLADKDMAIANLQGKITELQNELQKSSARLSSALDEQAKLTTENSTLEATVKKLTRDVAKLETFKKALMHSLQDEDENQLPSADVKQLPSAPVAVKSSVDDKQSPSSPLAVKSPISSAVPKQTPKQDIKSNTTQQQIFSLPSTNLNTGLSPSGSPRRHSASSSPKARSPPKRLTKGSSAATSPTKIRSKTSSSTGQVVKNNSKWHSIGDGRLSLPSSLPTSKHATAPNSPPQIAKTARVDGKEFFRQARNRLSYEQFSAFLANIKELNAHNQTREETLKKASEIFGPENGDLYTAFDGLLSRHLPGES